MRQYWASPLPPLHDAAGAALASSTTLTDISPTPPIVVPANMVEEGSVFRLRAAGFFSNTGTPTLLLGLYLGGVAGAAIAASSAITTASGVTAVPWILEYQGRLRTIGTTGTMIGQGKLHLGTSLTAFTVRPIPEVAANRSVTWDTTVAKSITVGAQWGTSNAANTITCDEISVELLS